MTWTRLDDLWTDTPELAELPHEVRWHYLCMIQFCSRTKRYDGAMKTADARRCSDVDDPNVALESLITAGLVSSQPGGVKVERVEEHIPPPSVREASGAAKIRKQRSRAHKNGDHSICLPDHCEHTSVDKTTGEVTGDVTYQVTRDTRTGQDGTGQAFTGKVSQQRNSEPLPVTDDGFPPELCDICNGPMEIYEPGQTTHPGCSTSHHHDVEQRWSA